MNRYIQTFLALLICTAIHPTISSAQGSDTVLPEAPLIASKFFGANRRVITGIGYTAVRGNFMLPTIRVPGNYNASTANSKPTFYLGSSQNGADDPTSSGVDSEADTGMQWEWEALPYNTGTALVTTPPGWSVFLYSSVGNAGRTTSNIRQSTSAGFRGWRCGPGTLNDKVTSVDMEWVLEKGPVIQTYGYLKINAIGAASADQPTGTTGFDSLGKIYATSGGNQVDFGPGTAGMRVKRVVGITQGGMYGSNRSHVMPTIPAVLRFPLSSPDKIYDEDGSYMEGCVFGGVAGQSSGQLRYGPPRQGVSPAWENWSLNADTVDRPSVELEADRRTGWYPGGKDRQYLNPTSYFGFSFLPLDTNATGFTDHFNFFSVPFSNKYDAEQVDISLRSATPTTGYIITPSDITDNIDQ